MLKTETGSWRAGESATFPSPFPRFSVSPILSSLSPILPVSDSPFPFTYAALLCGVRLRSKYRTTGAAMYTDEYVPVINPTIMVNAKGRIT